MNKIIIFNCKNKFDHNCLRTIVKQIRTYYILDILHNILSIAISTVHHIHINIVKTKRVGDFLMRTVKISDFKTFF